MGCLRRPDPSTHAAQAGQQNHKPNPTADSPDTVAARKSMNARWLLRPRPRPPLRVTNRQSSTRLAAFSILFDKRRRIMGRETRRTLRSTGIAPSVACIAVTPWLQPLCFSAITRHSSSDDPSGDQATVPSPMNNFPIVALFAWRNRTDTSKPRRFSLTGT